MKQVQKLLGKWRQTGRQESECAFLNSPFPEGFLWVHQRPLGFPGKPAKSPISAAHGTGPIRNPLPRLDLFLSWMFKLRSSVWDVMKPRCSSLHRFLPAPLGQLSASCWGSPLLPETLSLPCHLLRLIRDLGKSLRSSWAEVPCS